MDIMGYAICNMTDLIKCRRKIESGPKLARARFTAWSMLDILISPKLTDGTIDYLQL
jgi:hypothetical protein